MRYRINQKCGGKKILYLLISQNVIEYDQLEILFRKLTGQKMIHGLKMSFVFDEGLVLFQKACAVQKGTVKVRVHSRTDE